MSHTVWVVARPGVAAGFGLAGLRRREADTPPAGAAAIAELRSRTGVGVVLVESAFYDALPEDLRRAFGRNPLPMIVPFPGPSWEIPREEADAYVVELLRQVIGYRVRLR